MPTYEYECNKCRRVFEVRQRISEPALTTHDGCGGEVHRLLSPAPFILKGEGWYVTDYPSEARKKAILAMYEEPGFFQRTGPAEIEKLEAESRELGAQIDGWIAEWEAIEAELAAATEGA